MEFSIFNKIFASKASNPNETSKASKTNIANISKTEVSDLTSAEIDITYEIKDIRTDDMEMKNFLFSLGCFEGESITVISVLADNYIINIKDARYSIDMDLAKAIII